MANARFKHVCFIWQIAAITSSPDILLPDPATDTPHRLLPRSSSAQTDRGVRSAPAQGCAAVPEMYFPSISVPLNNYLYRTRHGTKVALAAWMPKAIRAAPWDHYVSGSGDGMVNARFKHVCFILQIAAITSSPDVLLPDPAANTPHRFLPQSSSAQTDSSVRYAPAQGCAAVPEMDFPSISVPLNNYLYRTRHGTKVALAAWMAKAIRAAPWDHYFSGSGGGMANARFKHVCFILQVFALAVRLLLTVPPSASCGSVPSANLPYHNQHISDQPTTSSELHVPSLPSVYRISDHQWTTPSPGTSSAAATKRVRSSPPLCGPGSCATVQSTNPLLFMMQAFLLSLAGASTPLHQFSAHFKIPPDDSCSWTAETATQFVVFEDIICDAPSAPRRDKWRHHA
ncbi:uncharacterized protein [Dermacentor albipictus]|uniref:uncharacterized protein n=1 Tax=Dermacentor albipictus TaxID=60249 RepID=UPI0038FC543E